MLPGGVRDVQQLGVPKLLWCEPLFKFLTSITQVHILVYSMVHVGPGVQGPQGCISLVCPKVRHQGGIVELVEDGSQVLPGDTDPRFEPAVDPHEISLPDVVPRL